METTCWNGGRTLNSLLRELGYRNEWGGGRSSRVVRGTEVRGHVVVAPRVGGCRGAGTMSCTCAICQRARDATAAEEWAYRVRYDAERAHEKAGRRLDEAEVQGRLPL